MVSGIYPRDSNEYNQKKPTCIGQGDFDDGTTVSIACNHSAVIVMTVSLLTNNS